MNHVVETVAIKDDKQQQQDDEYFRQMASTLVDNLLAKAIVKASQKLAFNSSTQNNEDIHHFNNNNNSNHCDQPNCNNCGGGYIQTKRKVSNPIRLKDPLPFACPSQTSSSSSSSSSTTTTARTSSSSTPPMSSTMASNTASASVVDINGNAPEIQIDLVGPRTPSPVEESSFELPPVERKQYKFKVETTNGETNQTGSSEDTKIRSISNNDDDDDDDDKNYIETNIDDDVDNNNNSNGNMYHCTNDNNTSQDNNTHKSITITIKGNLKKNRQYNNNGDKSQSSWPPNHSDDDNNNNERGRWEHDDQTYQNVNAKYEQDEYETNGQQRQQQRTKISNQNQNNNNNKNGKKQSKSIQIVEMMAFDEYTTTSQVDVATTPELEIDLEQAQELSKHIVSDIINQAVKRLNEDIKNNKHLKHEPESISKISCYSSRSMVQNNCSWLTRTRHAIRRIVRHACICARSKEDTATTLNDQPNLNDATNNNNNNGGGGGTNSGNHAQQQHRQHQCWSR